jgi:hypothetical protein
VALEEYVLFGGLQNVTQIVRQTAQLVGQGGTHVAIINPDKL